MKFANPHLLWLLLLLIPMTGWYVWKRRDLFAPLFISSISPFARVKTSWKQWVRHLEFALRLLAVAALIVVIARPQKSDAWRTSSVEGTDIIISMDISTSMLARDFEPNRFEAAKDVASRFVAGRQGDNMGLVIFAAESFSAVPMTGDRAMLSNYIHDLKMGMLQDGTAIGDGLATAVNRIRQGKAKSKSIILLTDGTNNTGNVAPLTAAEIAAKNGIKVYTIGVGTNGMADFPQEDMLGRISYVRLPVTIDEKTLTSIADMTGGRYFRATNGRMLSEVFEEIDKLEKTQLDVRSFSSTEDDYMPWAIAALALYLLAVTLRLTILRTIP